MAIKKASTPSDQAPVLPTPKPENSAEEFLEKHGKKTILLVILIIIGVAVSFYMQARQKIYIKESGQKFASAQTTDELQAVITDYPGSVAAGNAMLLLADRLLTKGEVEKAKIDLTKFVNEQKDTPLYFNGLFALGTVEERLGKTDRAKEIYQEIIDAGEQASTAAVAALRMADIIHEQGDLEGALTAYDAIAKNFPGNVFIDENGVIDSRKADINQSIILRDNPPPAPEPPAEPAPPVKKTDPVAPPAPAEKPDPAAPPAPAEKPDPAAPPAPPEKTDPVAPPAPPEKTDPAAPPAPPEKTDPEAPPAPPEKPDPVAPPAPPEKTDPVAPPAPPEKTDPAAPSAPAEKADPATPPGPE